MTEPATGLAAILGIKAHTVIAQLFGQLISLSFMAPMSATKKLATIASGVITAHYATLATLHFFPSIMPIEGAVGFAYGLVGMAVVKAILDAVPKIIEMFSERFIRR